MHAGAPASVARRRAARPRRVAAAAGQGDGDGGVAALVHARSASGPGTGGKSRPSRNRGAPTDRGHAGDLGVGLRRQLAQEQRHARLGDAGLLARRSRSACRPGSSVWSRPMLVMAVATGSQAVTASSRPPRPVSSTATSTPRLGEGQECQRRRDLEVGQRHAGGRRWPRRAPPADRRPPRAVDADALGESAEVRRRDRAPCAAPPRARSPRSSRPSSPCRWCRRSAPPRSARCGSPRRGQRRAHAVEAQVDARACAPSRAAPAGRR